MDIQYLTGQATKTAHVASFYLFPKNNTVQCGTFNKKILKTPHRFDASCGFYRPDMQVCHQIVLSPLHSSSYIRKMVDKSKRN